MANPTHAKDYWGIIKELNTSKVHVRDKDRVNKLIEGLVSGGVEKLQVIADFDRTITKQHEPGKEYLSSFGIFAKCKSLPQAYLDTELELKRKYMPIEVDPNIPFNEKKGLMEEWWDLAEQQLRGLTVPANELDDVVKDLGPSLRDNCVSTLTELHACNVPVLVYSAGLGDVVVSVLTHFNALLPNVKVISNFLQRDAADVITGFKDKMINVFNKHEKCVQSDAYFASQLTHRGNIIVLGDSIGDARMAQGASQIHVELRIGFLYDNVEGNLPLYLDHFDIVLVDDQTMDVLSAIFSQIKRAKPF